jgi:uncharacterized membrane protein
MKSSHFFALLKNDIRWVWPALFFGIYILFQNVTRNSTDHLFSLSYGSNGSDIFIFMIAFMSINPLFLNGNYGVKTANASQFGSLEFFFSRAISRTSQFCAKSCIYLSLMLLPLTTVWAYSHFEPPVRIEVFYSSKKTNEGIKQFYLQNFEGAYVKQDKQDREGEKYYIVLPEGQVDIATFTFLISFIGALIIQLVALVFSPTRLWKTLLAYFAVLTIPTILSTWGKDTPTYYESGLAWVAQHTVLAFLALVIFTTLCQLYCCRRFVQREITS